MKNKRFTLEERIEYYERQIVESSEKLSYSVERLRALKNELLGKKWDQGIKEIKKKAPGGA